MVLDTTRPIDLLECLDQARVDASSRLDPKQRARLGQFFTPVVTARLMGSMFTVAQPTLRLLDAGAGIGVLTAAFVSEVCRRESRPHHISVVAFELDTALGPRLEETLAACREVCERAGIGFEAEIRQEDFIAAAATSLNGDLFGSRLPPFDCAILNPPYRKINTDSRERRLLQTIGIETSNLYTAFLALVAGLLDTGGELVAITPRSFCNGPYFRSFRRTFLASMALRQVHVFDSRDNAFRDDAVLQETVIFRATKNASPDVVTITSSTSPESVDERSRTVEYAQIVRPGDPDAFIRLVPDDLGSEIAERMEGLPSRLDDLGLGRVCKMVQVGLWPLYKARTRASLTPPSTETGPIFDRSWGGKCICKHALTVSTGRVVDFRATEHLREEPDPSTVPLIYPSHFGADGFVAWPNPLSRKPSALARTSASESLLVPAGTYVLVRRFSAKEERRRVVASIYDADRVSPLPVGFENHLNYYHQGGAGLPTAVARGLAAFLNSTQVDTYFRQFNGHTQVNATDLRSLRYPTLDELAGLGEHIGDDIPTQSDIDWLIEGMVFGRPTVCPTSIRSESV